MCVCVCVRACAEHIDETIPLRATKQCDITTQECDLFLEVNVAAVSSQRDIKRLFVSDQKLVTIILFD